MSQIGFGGCCLPFERQLNTHVVILISVGSLSLLFKSLYCLVVGAILMWSAMMALNGLC